MTNLKFRRFWLGFLLLLSLTNPLHSAAKNPRIALFEGISADTGIGALPNPTADARLITKTLESLRFDTYLTQDTDQGAMKSQIAYFGHRL